MSESFTYSKPLHHGTISCLALLLGLLPIALLAQDVPPAQYDSAHASSRASDCDLVVNVRDVVRCLAQVPATAPIPKLDPTHTYDLPELIDIAESSSPEARIAWAQAKQSLERTGIDRAEYLPLMTFAAQGEDARVLVPFPKPIAPRGYVTVEDPTLSAELELQYSLLDFGRRSRLESAKAVEIASTLRLGRTQQTIEYSVATEFYRTQQAQGELDAAQAILQTAETLEDSAQLGFDHGRATLPDLQNAKAGAAEARLDLAAAEGAVKKEKLTLTEAIGIEPTDELTLAPQSADGPEAFESSVETLIQTAWKARPDVLARAQDLRHSQQDYKTARSAYLPNLDFHAAGGQTAIWPAADYGDLGHGSISTWSVQAELRWEVFNGARRHEVSSSFAEEKAAAEQQRATKDAVTRQVWEAYVDYQTALQQEQAAQNFLSAAQTSYNSSLDAFRYGVRSLVDVVEAERQLAQARLGSVRARASRLQSEISLSYATEEMLQDNSSPTRMQP
jgi:outer membrane protein TolC